MTYDLLGVVLLLALVLLSAARLATHRRLTAPAVSVNGYDVERHPLLVTDPEDAGVRVTDLTVASPVPLTLTACRYTVQARGTPAAVTGGTHAEARAALEAMGLDPTTWSLTGYTTGARLAPGTPHVVFALTTPVVRRLDRLSAEMTLVDPLGRRLVKTVPALPQAQPLNRAVSAQELGVR